MTLDLSRAAETQNAARFEAAMQRHREHLIHEAGRYVGVDDAEDMVQDAFVKAWAALQRGGYYADGGTDPDRGMRAWLFRITQNRCRDWLDHVRVLGTMLEFDPDIHDYARVQDDRLAEQTQARSDLRAVWARLSWKEQRAMLALAQGIPVGTLSGPMGMKPKSVKSLTFRGRQKALAWRAAQSQAQP